MRSPTCRIWLMRLGVFSLFLITLIPTQNLMIDRFFMALEILLLLRMLKLDQTNQMAISQLLEQRKLWYQRRAQQKLSNSDPSNLESVTPPTGAAETATAIENSPEISPGSGETLVILQESENEQTEL